MPRYMHPEHGSEGPLTSTPDHAAKRTDVKDHRATLMVPRHQLTMDSQAMTKAEYLAWLEDGGQDRDHL